MKQEQIACISCGNPDAGKFCSECGERLSPRRISWNELLSDYWNNTLAFDVPFFRTLKQLAKRPGAFAREYVEGIRKPYYKPIPFFLIVLAIQYLIMLYSLDFEELMSVSNSGLDKLTEEQRDAFMQFQVFNEKWGKTMQFAQLPFFAFFSWLLFRKRSSKNFLENVVLIAYLLSAILILNVVTSQTYRLGSPALVQGISLLLFFGILAYYSWGISSFHGKVTAGLFFRAMLVTVLSIFIYSMTVGLFTFVYLWDEIQPILTIGQPQ